MSFDQILQSEEALKEAQESVRKAEKSLRRAIKDASINNPTEVSFNKILDVRLLVQEITTKHADWGTYEAVDYVSLIVKTDTVDFIIDITGSYGKYYGHARTTWTLPKMNEVCGRKLHNRLRLWEFYETCVGTAKGLHYAVGLITQKQYEQDHKDFDIEVDETYYVEVE